VLESDLLALATDVASEAAALIGRSVAAEVDTKSTVTDMVTEVDRASEALIVGRLRAVRPDDAIVAEEGSYDVGTSGVRWIVDPLDGTTNFLYRYPTYAVSIAAEIDGEVAVGVVRDVVLGETFTAVRGGGAFCNGVSLHVAGAGSLATALVGTGFSYNPERRAAQGAVVAHLLPLVRDIRRSGSAALDQCWVAARRLDGFYEGPLAPWDLAAARLIASEAGAWVGDLDGVAVAVVPQLADAFVAALREAGV
jgi:myo-inositol-1(or 4)-monophosphatase